ncbi:Predicted kinase, aminoglycoside phosphotransferase (APT) family [Actinacidiphila yanglinensis]|uniref:Predicted kinase, aminoglycoside phosphotransferase (APT) family n=1 Tax=Actinacidiphila yanglinensis TaxID=310779 RepID=A0A1H6C6E7_9ACTN|nr:aminoglycoside phosphotransferase family protein [Actinacidiphila yanglinensis]SEG68473.1 Predicted kinase, aminoglycoside phosphotransferase (APT) family [Actinacidiphila yanglinensis]
MKMHANELTVTPRTVRALVDAQFPEWSGLPLRRVGTQGTVNAVYRIGDRLAARLPLQGDDPASTRRLLESEAAAARELAGRTRFATPEPVALGGPGAGYPLPWSVQTWLPGTVADDEDPGGSTAFAGDLADLLTDLRAIPTQGRTFSGTGRGGELRSHDTWMETCFRHSGQLLDVPRLRRQWAALRDLPRGADRDVMAHGDLIAGNVLVAAGRLAGVLDVGGFGPADPSLDLVGAWHLLEAAPRQVLRERLGCGEIAWGRGKAWAFVQAMGLVWYYVESNPSLSLMGRRTLERIMADGPAA